MKKAEREHMAKVKEMPCIVCGNWPVDVHHAETKMGLRKDHMKVLPLCFDHHRGDNGIGTIGRKAWQARYGNERDHLARVNEEVGYGD